MKPILTATNIKVHFPVRKGWFSPTRFVKAVEDVNLEVQRGETLAIVGESGSGKSSLGRALLRLGPITEGSLTWDGNTDMLGLSPEALRVFRRKMQMVFQDPYASLNPRHTAGTMLAEPLQIHGLAKSGELKQKVAQLLESVGLAAADATKYPHQFSGGQRQRLAIARALAVQPELIVADEPVSALDMSVQAQVLGLLEELKQRFNLTYVFISHDLGVVRRVANRVAVMYLGHIVEQGETNELFQSPKHPYTEALLATLSLESGKIKENEPLLGEIPSPLNPPTGCPFQTRCPKVLEKCRREYPPWVKFQNSKVACFIYSQS